jgi:hypothetical protein
MELKVVEADAYKKDVDEASVAELALTAVSPS